MCRLRTAKILTRVLFFSLLFSSILFVNTAYANGMVDLDSARKITIIDDPVSDIAMSATGLSDGKTGLLYFNEPTSNNYHDYYKVVDPEGSTVYTKDLSALMGARANNVDLTSAYGIADGKSLITWEGTINGCDNNTGSMFQFVILDVHGNI